MASAPSPAAVRDPVAWDLAPLPSSLAPAAARAFCRAVATRHYENFTVATLLVPRPLRQHLANVYTFARWADDLADEAASPVEATAALADWRQQLEACFAGRPDHPVFVALAETVSATASRSSPSQTSSTPSSRISGRPATPPGPTCSTTVAARPIRSAGSS